MKIGINSRIYQNDNTGIPYYIESLYKYCIKNDKKNNYIFFQTQKNKTIGNTVIRSLKNTVINAFLFDNFLVNSLIRKNMISVYHGPASILPFFKVKGVRYLVTIHDLSFLYFKNNQSLMFNYYYKFFIRRSIKNADVVIADSENTKKDILKYYKNSQGKIKVIYLGVNEVFLSSKKRKRIINDEYFFTLSTHPKRKNIYRILDILSENKKLQSYKFVIAGLIPDDQMILLKEKISQLDLDKNVIIFGYVSEENLISLYQYAKFFIYPSYYEGFGLPVLEAMVSKCPVIASNTSSIPEITPTTRWLVDPYNSRNIAEIMISMVELSSRERSSVIEKNYQFARQFTWEKCARQMIEIFEA